MEDQQKFETLSEEEQQKILEKYDPESATRKVRGPLGWIIFFGLLAFSIFQLYASITQSIPRQILLSVHLGFTLSLIYLLFPVSRRIKKKNKVAWYDIILSIIAVGIGAYWPIMIETIVNRGGH